MKIFNWLFDHWPFVGRAKHDIVLADNDAAAYKDAQSLKDNICHNLFPGDMVSRSTCLTPDGIIYNPLEKTHPDIKRLEEEVQGLKAENNNIGVQYAQTIHSMQQSVQERYAEIQLLTEKNTKLNNENLALSHTVEQNDRLIAHKNEQIKDLEATIAEMKESENVKYTNIIDNLLDKLSSIRMLLEQATQDIKQFNRS